MAKKPQPTIREQQKKLTEILTRVGVYTPPKEPEVQPTGLAATMKRIMDARVQTRGGATTSSSPQRN